MALKGCPKYGGRKKGTRNKNALPLHEIATKLGFDPFLVLCQFAMGNYKSLGLLEGEITVDHRLKATSEACQYLYPKRKAIEVKDIKDPNDDRPYRDLTDEELDNM